MNPTVRIALSAAMLSSLVLSGFALGQGGGAGPVGVWASEAATSHIKIEDCAGKLCGAIVWLKEPLDRDGREKTDSENPDPALKGRKLIGLRLLEGFTRKADEPLVWAGGTIYNPTDGKTYRCTLTVKDPGTLYVRGYVGIPLLGKSQTWTRVE